MNQKENFLEMIKLAKSWLKTLDTIEKMLKKIYLQKNKIVEITSKMKLNNPMIWEDKSTSEEKYETNLSKELRELEKVFNDLKSDIMFDNREIKLDIFVDVIDELKKVAEKQNAEVNHLYDIEKTLSEKTSYNNIDTPIDNKEIINDLKKIAEKNKEELNHFYDIEKILSEERSYNNIDTPIDNKEIITNLNDEFKEYTKIDEKTEKNIDKIYLNIEVLEKQMIDFTRLFYALMSDIEAKATEFDMEEQWVELEKIILSDASLIRIKQSTIDLKSTNTKTPKSYIEHSSKLKESEEKLFKIIHNKSPTEVINETSPTEENEQKKSLKNILNKLKDFLNKIKSKIKGEEGSYDLISSDTDKQSKNILNKLKDFLNNIKQKTTVNKTSKEGSIEEIITKGPTQTFVKTNANSEENLEFHSDERNSLERSDSFSFIDYDDVYYSTPESIDKNDHRSISNIKSIENDHEYPSSRNKSFTETLKEERDEKDPQKSNFLI